MTGRRRFLRGENVLRLYHGQCVEQKLGGAALDVTAIEPLAADSPLWKTPHLMMTPHTSAVSDRLWKRQTEILAELLERWFGGRELFNRVDLSRGY